MLTVEEVSKSFRSGPLTHGRKVLGSVSLEINKGEVVGLLGESGCGKTTLAKIMMRLVRPDNGRVRMDGMDITAMSERRFREHRHRVQMIFQDPSSSMNPAHSVRWSLDEAYEHYGDPGKYLDLMRTFGLPQDILQRRPALVSGGELQRVSILRCLASEPDYLILDEPTSMLDLSVQASIMRLLLSVCKDRGMMLISHDIDLVERVCDRVYVMHQGSIIEEGMTHEVLNEPRTDGTRTLLEYFR